MAVLVGALTAIAGCSSGSGDTPQAVTSTQVSTTVVTATRTTTSPAAQSTSSSQTSDVPTSTVTLVAVDSAGRPINGFEVNSPNPAGEIDCAHASVSRSSTTGGIYECGASAQSADVCWAAKSNTQLLCGDSPWSRKLDAWTITSGTLPTSGAPSAQPEPWGLELADGRQCRIRVGGAWGGRSDGRVGAYSCTGSDRDVVLMRANATSAVDRSSTTWLVEVGPLGAGSPSFPAPDKVAVRTAYFAAAAG
ncbi:hypothetical protein HH308_03875 [Gordonia sp. TBRC 11910]|uniref:Uncharacterized protein n=1 Tax=Gordonia asplenii TaxID=2725283 RepID=A0A848KPU2_9ACTN|nr:hypothetical protein [Gordonia asplenii]NMO00350.1 hypothetical protein [Gordonia asplenii]